MKEVIRSQARGSLPAAWSRLELRAELQRIRRSLGSGLPGGGEMTEWYLWDGNSQRGPMNRTELYHRIQYHPTPSVVRVWRDGFADWKTVEEVFDTAGKSSLEPTTFERSHEASTKTELPHEALKKTKYQNFVAQNWRGECPLWVSYWVFGFLSNAFAVVVIALVGAYSEAKAGYGPIGILLFYIFLWSFIASLTIWQLVGIWRSAQRRITERSSMGKRAPWAGLAKLMVCLGYLQLFGLVIRSAIPQIAEATSIAFMDDPKIPSYSIRVMSNGSEAEIAGGIKFGLSSDFEKILNASRGVRTVDLNSIGGRIGEGEKLSSLIKSRGLDTYVDTNCLSACTLAFVAGRQRILKRGAQLGFHRGSFAGEDQVDDRTSGIERSIYKAAGISNAFIDQALATKNANIWKPSEAELVSAGVITSISEGDEFALAGFGVKSRADWDKGLQDVAVYGAIKEKYPKTYDEILDIFSKGTEQGVPQGELTGQVRAKVNGLVKKSLPYADDKALVDFGRLIVDQYRAVQLQDPAACYSFASGASDTAALPFIPKALKDREIELDAIIIKSARKRDAAAKTDPLWEKIRANLGQKGFTTSDWHLMTAKSVTSTDYARYCRMVIAVYQEITNLPPNEAATVIREMFS